ncbi:hypothetical protein ACYPKM_01235 [Pseudomonas aeruginosa]
MENTDLRSLLFEVAVKKRQLSWHPGKTGINSDLVALIDELPSDYLAGQMVVALHNGDTVLASTIWEKRGPFSLTLTYDEEWDNRIVTIDGRETVVPSQQFGEALYYLDHESETEHLQLIALVSGQFDPSVPFYRIPKSERGWLMMIPDCERFPYGQASRKPAVELPRFDGQRVHHSETIRVSQSRWSNLPEKWWGDCLCFASKEAVDEYPDDLKPYRPYIRARVINEQGNACLTKPLKTYAADFRSGEAPYERLEGFSFGLEADNQVDTSVDRVLVSETLSDLVRQGLAAPEGYVLCRTTISFLSSFEFDQPMNLDMVAPCIQARSLTNRLVAMSMPMAKELQETRCDRESSLALIADPDYQHHLIECLGLDVIKSLLLSENAKAGLWPEQFLFVQERFGVPADQLCLRIWQNSPDAVSPDIILSRGHHVNCEGFDASSAQPCAHLVKALESVDGDLLVNGIRTTGPDEELIERTSAALLALYEFDHESDDNESFNPFREEDVSKALEELNRPLHVFRSVWAYRGIDRFAAVAATAMEWEFAAQLYGRKALAPYWRNVPSAAKVKIASTGLSI